MCMKIKKENLKPEKEFNMEINKLTLENYLRNMFVGKKADRKMADEVEKLINENSDIEFYCRWDNWTLLFSAPYSSKVFSIKVKRSMGKPYLNENNVQKIDYYFKDFIVSDNFDLKECIAKVKADLDKRITKRQQKKEIIAYALEKYGLSYSELLDVLCKVY